MVYPFRPMDIVALTRELVDIESTTGNEGPVGHFLLRKLRELGYNVEQIIAEGERCQRLRHRPAAAQSRRRFLHPHGYRAALHSFLGR